MQRFNQGFFKFGPLEQCKDGELCYYSDVEKIVEIVEDNADRLIDGYQRRLMGLETELQDSRDRVDSLELELKRAKLSRVRVRVLVCAVVAVQVASWVALVAAH